MQPAPPCGSAPAAAPTADATYEAGSVVAVLLQQNLNHYAPGSPGVIDVSLGPYPAPLGDDGNCECAWWPQRSSARGR